MSNSVPFNEPVPLITKELVKQFLQAIVSDQAEAAAMLSKKPALLDARCVHEASVIHFLTSEGRAPGVRFLAEHGADVNLKNKFGNTPLMDAALIGNEEIVAILLNHEANTNILNSSFETPLMSAVRSGNARVVEMLLERGADATYRSPTGKTIFDVMPMHSKARLGIYRVLERFAEQTSLNR